MRKLSVFTWLSLLTWLAMIGWLNTPRKLSFEDYAPKDPTTGEFTLEVSGFHYGLRPVLGEFQYQWIYMKILQNLAVAGIIAFALIRLSQDIRTPKLRDYFLLVTIAAIVIVVGNKMTVAGKYSSIETTIQLACVAPIPLAVIQYKSLHGNA